VQIPWVIAAVMLVPAIGAAAVAVLVPSRRLLKVNIAEMVTYE
jgi:ABC-type antimicrobial peptide transport system permease subunit